MFTGSSDEEDDDDNVHTFKRHLFEFIAYMSVLGVIIYYAACDLIYHVPIDHYRVAETIPSTNEYIRESTDKVETVQENLIL